MSPPVVVLESADAPLKGKPVCHTKTMRWFQRETNRSTVGVILRERCSDDGVVGQMPEIGKVLVGVHDRCRKRKRSRKSRCHRVIAVVIRLRNVRLPPRHSLFYASSRVPRTPRRRRHGWSVMEPPHGFSLSILSQI